MPGFLVQAEAQVLCIHTGQAQPLAPNPQVTIDGQPVVTQESPYAIAGCALAGTGSPPCVTGQWITGAAKVLVDGVPVLLQDSQAICQAPGTGLIVAMTQIKVRGM